LPKKRVESEKGEIIDPYVSLQIYGASADNAGPFYTRVVDNNGFNPVWGESFSF
jgi:Ca2+-dependent lipid-binding protein